MPPVKLRGKGRYTRDVVVRSSAAIRFWLIARMFPWVIIAPFGDPVVPDV